MYTLLQLSDTHLVADPLGSALGGLPAPRLSSVVRAWLDRGEQADLVVLSGDVADDESAAAYAQVRALIEPIAAPVLAVPGNHEDAAALVATIGSAERTRLGAWMVVGFNSAVPNQVPGRIDAELVARTLDEIGDGSHVVVVMHHPPHSLSEHPWFRLEGADELFAVLAARPNVRVLLTGHLHAPFDVVHPSGLRMLGAPSTLVHITHGDDGYTLDRDGHVGARIVHLHDDGTVTTELLLA